MSVTGHATSLRFCFALFGLGERYRDFHQLGHWRLQTSSESITISRDEAVANLSGRNGRSCGFVLVPRLRIGLGGAGGYCNCVSGRFRLLRAPTQRGVLPARNDSSS